MALVLMDEIFPSILKNFNSIGKLKEYYNVLQLDSSAELIILAVYKYICFFPPQSFESELSTLWYFTPNQFRLCFLKVTKVPQTTNYD